ncbi:MAG: hypothetical protein KatS3mg058_3300 [Roseiflexus sp.]|nr:MAG: hypothetical protein KatS3mg058_3300 [Roseiflexus sp.]
MVGPLAPHASPQMRDTSRATPWSDPSRLATNARYIARYAMVGPLSPRASPQMRDTSRATPWSDPSRLATNARYIARDVGPLTPRHKCEIHRALRHGRTPRASPQMRDTSRATSGPSRLATNARYIARDVGPLAPRHQCEIHRALRHGRAPPRLSPPFISPADAARIARGTPG